MTRSNRAHVTTLVLLFAGLVWATPAFAGPPLLCHPFQIGSAQSLPWDGSGGWSHVKGDYKIANVVSDTDALLTPSTPVLVRMETLRRASLYASTDAVTAKRLLDHLLARVDASEAKGRADALALLDAAYVTEAFREIASMSSSPEFADRVPGVRAAIGKTDAYALISRSIAARPDDPAIQFAAALIAADKNRDRYDAHASKARAGAASDQLLARNLSLVESR
jgi:hypothetical protein